MLLIRGKQLIKFATAILKSAGTPDDIAAVVAESLVTSNLYGHDSHGIILLVRYIQKIQNHNLKPAARPAVDERHAGTATVNANWSFGQVAARFGAELACEIAVETGISCVSLSKVNHIGRLGEYAAIIAECGFIGLVLTTGSMSGGQVAPYGGRERRFGTNPIAWGLPIGGGATPLISDFATAAYSVGKVGVIERKGETLPDGILIDGDGHPTNDPAIMNSGGMLLPFGGYKGYGLALIIEIIASTLSGFAPASSKDFEQGNPTLMMAIDIERFTPKARYQELVQEVLDSVKETKPAPGFDEVLLPGETEQRSYADRSTHGIPLDDATWGQLVALGQQFNITIGDV